MANKTIKVKQVASPIGRPAKQKAVLIGLGLNKMNKVVELEDTKFRILSKLWINKPERKGAATPALLKFRIMKLGEKNET